MRQDRGGGNFRSRSFAPVKVGDEIDVKIEAVGEKGDGIAKKDGFVLFVPDTKEGDEVRIRITRVLQKVGFAEVAGQKSEQQEEAGANEEAPAESTGQPSEEAQSSESEEQYAGQDTEDFGEEKKEE